MAPFFFSRRDYSSPKRDDLDEFNLVRRKERRKQFWSVYVGVVYVEQTRKRKQTAAACGS